MTVWTLSSSGAVAGGVGAGLRYIVDVLVMRGRRGGFPLGILLVNVTGSFALGVLTGLGRDRSTASWSWPLGVGLLGGYTTFSTVSVESVLLVRGAERRDWAGSTSGHAGRSPSRPPPSGSRSGASSRAGFPAGAAPIAAVTDRPWDTEAPIHPRIRRSARCDS